ncbi:Isovaleryl-CoA dehydrogenase, mitochondrial [Hypsizygus marmoreus]|uniref:Isovaleryl-CoA dehydrogenase, mitochondrial n=1 Tax=Hypsizygus marmoreus TaxID=39966 RepID=A0A369JX47_HYPMA|nr:Isovaleryl-CoA dehydrogenase, mitochondrial [Hypsizygus marmoreus]
MTPPAALTLEFVSKHNVEGDLWIIVDSSVYDISKFATIHPGGLSVLLNGDIAGQDATKAFYGLHRSEILRRPQYARLKIGELVGRDEQQQNVPPDAIGSTSSIPYAEPTWLAPGYRSPYYKDSHRQFQLAVRQFVEDVIFPDAQRHEEDGKPPSQHVFDEMGRLNIIAMRLGPGKHLQGRALMRGIVKPEEFDHFHELIIAQELGRIHARGYSDGLGGGTCIGLPPILNFGKPVLRDKIVPDVLAGKKFISLAVTEAFAGSDVAGLKCHAKRVKDGWVVTGTYARLPESPKDRSVYVPLFSVFAARTDAGGLVVLVIPRSDGVQTKLIKTSYSTAAGTAYVTFDEVHVPYENTLGSDNGGLQVILSNFNHERWGLTCGAVSAQRTILEECLKWATQREVFGKPLASQAVVRSKLAQMIARVETSQNWLESITFQMVHMNYKEQASKLAGQIAFLKMFTSRNAQDTARDAVQLFGGRGITRSGMGKFIEHYHRTLLIDAVGGGAEDVLGDLGVRQALRMMPKNVRL